MKRDFQLAGWLLLIASPWAFAQKQPRRFSLKAESPRFWELIAKDSKLDLVSGGMGFTEGPVGPAGFIYVSDEVRNKIFRIYPMVKRRTDLAGRSGWQYLRSSITISLTAQVYSER